MDLENNLHLNDFNIENIAVKLYKKLKYSYISYECNNKECDWNEDCKIIKWLCSYPTDGVKKEQKLKDYCRFKKVVNSALYEGITQALGKINEIVN